MAVNIQVGCNAEENEEYMANILATVEFQEFMEEMNETSEHALFWSNPTLALYADKIFSVDSLTISQASVRKGSDGSAERMSWLSLKTICDDVLALHCQHLVETYSMVKTQCPKQYWGPPELCLLIEQDFKNIVHPSSRRGLDMILQHIFLWTLLLMMGCRPGSLLSNYMSGAILEKRTAYSTQTTLQNVPALHRSMHTKPIKPLSLEEAMSSNDHLKGLFMQHTFLSEHLKMGFTQWTTILPTMDESFVVKQGLLPELQLACKVHNREEDEKDNGNNQELDLEDFNNRESLKKYADLYKAVTRSTHTCVSMPKAKTIYLLKSMKNITRISPKSLHEEELEKCRISRAKEDPQGEFDEELGMECVRLQGQSMDQLMVKHVALLQVWTNYVNAEIGRQQCFLCLQEDDLPDSVRECFHKSQAVLLEHQRYNHPEICNTQNASTMFIKGAVRCSIAMCSSQVNAIIVLDPLSSWCKQM
ncbi:hypothetical protein EDD18DRAFT_1114011 [Armillaria luteobubalina]|uniref:Uncharacterized protein n=1 Tax=Armillaria luteobubalina TaxID=153913 RepID=A0AA39P7U3_9AGAR|nr:hypothetical protein EDD18DRAFT_1114011 [Armillaria luteobubalina]